jgi:hypothetical protein
MQKLAGMASYTQFLGRIVTVQYRAGDMLLSAYGSFVGDSGRSIFLEQHVEQRGKRSYFRWEIPYQYIHRILVDSLSEKTQASAADGGAEVASEKAAAAIAGQSAAGATSGLSLPRRSKTA